MTSKVTSSGVTYGYAPFSGHNQLQTTSLGGAPQLGYVYDAEGNRIQDIPQTGSPADAKRYYHYDAVGRLTGTDFFAGVNWIPQPDVCRYDALGRRVNSCDPSNTFSNGYDGNNVSVTSGGWRFVHGPGLDDPILGVFHPSGDATRYYFFTDGAGRHIVSTDTAGHDAGNVGAMAAGATDNGQTFEPGRAPGVGNGLAGLSFFRNRYYDQNTGRWTQEAPIGPASGTNLYAYVGNNPVSLSDPFGLCDKIMQSKAPCDLIKAAYSEVNPAHARAESEAMAWAIINRTQDGSPGRYGYTNSGNLDADIVGQVGAPNQVQGKGNRQWDQASKLLAGQEVTFSPGDGTKFSAVVDGVEAAYAAATSGGTDSTGGATFWDHAPSRPGQGASTRHCAPTALTSAGSMGLAKCSK